MVRSKTISFSGGSALPNLSLELDSQQTPIRSIIVDCTQSPVGCNVYQGVDPTGQIIPIAAGAYRCIPLSQSNSLYVTFPITPAVAGSIFLAWSDQEQQGFGSNVTAITNFPNPLPVSASGIFPVSSASTLATIKTNDYPQNSVAWEGQILTSFTSPQTLVSLPAAANGHTVYLMAVVIRGLDFQKTKWTLGGGNFATINPMPAGIGDINLLFNPPIIIGAATATATLTLTSGDTILGTLNLSGFAQGYYI